MKKLLLIALILLCSASVSAQPRWEAILDLAPLIPQGDLADSYSTPSGVGAGNGFEVGLRLRQLQGNSAWAIAINTGSPGKYSNENDGDPFEITTTLFRYSADYTLYLPAKPRSAQLFITAGGSYVRNVYHDEYLSDGSYFEHTFNAIGANAGVGLKRGDLEFTLSYHMNRFNTFALFDAEDYNWDYVTARIGLILPSY